MGLFILASGAVHAGNIVNEATTHLEVANMVSQCGEKERLTADTVSLFIDNVFGLVRCLASRKPAH